MKHRTVEIRDRASFTIIPLGDIHVGAKNVDYSALNRTIQKIEEKGAFWLGMGDYVDSIVWGDKRFNAEGVDREVMTVEEQYFKIVDLLQPISDLSLGLLVGNHDDTLRKRFGINFVKLMGRELNVPVYDYSVYMRLKISNSSNHNRYSIFVFAHHGSFSGRTVGGKASKILSLQEIALADIYLMGHVHELMVFKKPILDWGNKFSPFERERLFVVTGSYLKSFNEHITYQEERMYNATGIGSPTLLFNVKKKKINVSI